MRRSIVLSLPFSKGSLVCTLPKCCVDNAGDCDSCCTCLLSLEGVATNDDNVVNFANVNEPQG